MRLRRLLRSCELGVACLLLAVSLLLAAPVSKPEVAGPGSEGHHAEPEPADGTSAGHCHPGIDCFYPTILISATHDVEAPVPAPLAFRMPRDQASSLRLGFDPPPPRA